MTVSTPPPARIAVMGAGAVGCYYGGMLARAGHPVTLIGRPVHVQAILSRGLRLQTQSGDVWLRMHATTQADGARDADVVLVCVKSPDTEAAADTLRPHLAPGALVLSLQNGVDNAARLCAALPCADVLAAVVYVAAGMAGPGHVRHHGRGELLIAPGPRSDALAQIFCAAGVPTAVDDQVDSALWAKLTINCAYNALSALGRIAYGDLVTLPGVPDLMHDVVAECRAVARAQGIDLPATIDDAVRQIATSMATQVSSTAQDLMRGHPTEIDHLNGHVVRQGDKLGVPTPANRALWVAVRLLERQAGTGPIQPPA